GHLAIWICGSEPSRQCRTIPEPKEWPEARTAPLPPIATGAIALTGSRERLEVRAPGRRWPVKAASRRSRARAARALTGQRRSGSDPPCGLTLRGFRSLDTWKQGQCRKVACNALLSFCERHASRPAARGKPLRSNGFAIAQRAAFISPST